MLESKLKARDIQAVQLQMILIFYFSMYIQRDFFEKPWKLD